MGRLGSPVTRRVKKLYFSPEWAINMCLFDMEYNFLVVSGAPDGYKIEYYGIDREKQTFFVVISHESFDIIPFGGEIPELVVEFEKTGEDDPFEN